MRNSYLAKKIIIIIIKSGSSQLAQNCFFLIRKEFLFRFSHYFFLCLHLFGLTSLLFLSTLVWSFGIFFFVVANLSFGMSIFTFNFIS
jgi:hypothetical protein